MVLKTIIFDFDGTIADTIDLLIECAKEICHKHGYRVPSDKEIEELRALSAKEVIQNHLGIEVYMIPILLAEGWAMFSKRKEEIKAYGRMPQILSKLTKKYEVLVLSSNKEEVIRVLFKKWGLKCNGIYHCAKLFGKEWGLKRIIKERNLEGHKDRIVYVGDEIRDANACKRAGIKMIPVLWGLNNEKAFRREGFLKKEMTKTPREMEMKIKKM